MMMMDTIIILSMITIMLMNERNVYLYTINILYKKINEYN